MGVSFCTSIHVSINRMKTVVSIIFFASILNWIEGAPFSKLSSHDAILLSASHSGDICKNLELQESEHHLLVDPEDCKKFFSCQYSRSGWLAYSMSCADGTHFDGVYCVTGDSCIGIDLVNKTKIPTTTITTEIPTTIITTEIPTTTITTEIPTTTITTEIPITTITTEMPTTTITTEIPTTTITTTEIPTTTITTTEIPITTITTEIPTTTITTTEIP